MADLTVQADVVVNAEGAEAAFTRVGDKADKMAVDVAAASGKAGAAVDGIGTAAESGAERFTRSESRMRDAIKRSTEQLQLLGKTASQQLEYKIETKGLDGAKFAPYIAELKQATDIITSLQGGQAPMTVLLQQGGQLKDMFGGVGNATKALGGYVLGLVNPFTAAVTAVGAVGFAAYQASESAKELNKALLINNGASGDSISQLNSVADSLASVGIGYGTASSAITEFIGAGVKAGSSLQEFTKNAIDLERVGGAAVKETAKAFADLAKDPLSNLNVLTLATYMQVEALLEQGKKVEAVRVAQAAFNDENKRLADGLRAQEGALDTSIRYWKDFGVSVWNTVRGMAVAASLAPKTGNEQRAELQKRRDFYAENGYDTTKEDAQLAFYKQLDDAQQQGLLNQKKEIELKGLLAALDAKDDSIKKLRERNQLIADNTRLLEAGLISQKRYDDVLADFDKKNAKKVDKAPKDTNPFAEEQGKLFAKSIEDFDKAALKAQVSMDGLTSSQGKMVELLLNPAFQSMPETWKQTVLQAGFAAIAIEQARGETEKETKATALATAERQKYVESLGKQSATLEDQIRKQLDHNASIGKTAEAIAEITAARQLESAAVMESNAIRELDKNLDEEKYMATMKVVKGIREKAAAEAEGGRLKTAFDENKKLEAEWKRTSDSIERSLTDSLMRGWESGKGMWESFRDYITNSAKSWVIKIAVQPIMGLVNGIAGSIGIPGAQAASGSGLFGNLGGIGSALGSFGGTIATGFMNTLSGSGMMAGLESAGAMMGSGFMAQGLGMAAGALGPLALGIGALSALSNAMQYKITPNGGALVANVGASGASAVANRTDFTQTGGLFGGGTTQNSEWANADAGTTAYIDAAVKAVSSGNLAYAKALGLSGEALEGYTKQLTINTSGMDAAAAKAAIDSAIILFSNDQAQAAFGDSISAFAKEGEKAGETLARLATDLNSVNAWASTFGVALLEVSVMGAAAAATLVDAFGGLDAMNNSLSTFYKNYYTEEEQRQKTLQGVQTSLAANDISVSMEQLNNATIEGVRAWVDAAKALYDAGVFTAAQLAAAISAANDIAGIAKENSTKKDAAEQAPVVAQEPNFGGTTGMGSNAGAGSASGANPLDGIRTWLEDRRRSDASGLDIFTQKANAWATFQMQLVLSKAGDQTALGRITKDADVLLAAIDKTASSSFEQRLATAKVESQVGSLLNQKPEQLIVKAVDTVNNTLLDGFAALTGQGGIVSGGPLTGSLPVKVQTAGNVQQRTTVQSSFQSAPTTYSADPVMLPLLSGSPAKGDATNLATAMASVKELLDLIKANTESGAISNAKVARILDRVITSDDAIATQVIMPTGTYVPTRAV